MLMKQEYGYDNVYNMALKVHNIQPKGIYIGCEPDYINAIKEIFFFNKNGVWDRNIFPGLFKCAFKPNYIWRTYEEYW